MWCIIGAIWSINFVNVCRTFWTIQKSLTMLHIQIGWLICNCTPLIVLNGKHVYTLLDLHFEHYPDLLSGRNHSVQYIGEIAWYSKELLQRETARLRSTVYHSKLSGSSNKYVYNITSGIFDKLQCIESKKAFKLFWREALDGFPSECLLCHRGRTKVYFLGR